MPEEMRAAWGKGAAAPRVEHDKPAFINTHGRGLASHAGVQVSGGRSGRERGGAPEAGELPEGGLQQMAGRAVASLGTGCGWPARLLSRLL